MQATSWMVPLVAAAVGSAQSFVAPLGNDYLAGTENGSGWNAAQVRFLMVLDRSQFPWGSRTFELTGLELRRNTGIIYELDQHTRTTSVVLSVGGRPPTGLSPSFTNNHGPQRTTVLSQAAVSFPCATRIDTIGAFVAAEPVVSFSFPGSRFVVPAGAPNLVIEFQVHHDLLSVDWPLDHESSASDRGGMRRMGNECPWTPRECWASSRQPRPLADVGSTGFAVGQSSSLWTVLDSSASAGLLMLGAARTTPIPLPNGCSLWVDAAAFLPLTAGRGKLTLDLDLPNQPEWIGQVIGGQFAVVGGSSGYALGPGVALTIGSAAARTAGFASVIATAQRGAPLPENGVVEASGLVIAFLGTAQ